MEDQDRKDRKTREAEQKEHEPPEAEQREARDSLEESDVAPRGPLTTEPLTGTQPLHEGGRPGVNAGR